MEVKGLLPKVQRQRLYSSLIHYELQVCEQNFFDNLLFHVRFSRSSEERDRAYELFRGDSEQEMCERADCTDEGESRALWTADECASTDREPHREHAGPWITSSFPQMLLSRRRQSQPCLTVRRRIALCPWDHAGRL